MSEQRQKLCGSCGQTKCIRQFHRQLCAKDGYQNKCVTCAAEIRKAWRKKWGVNGKERKRDSAKCVSTYVPARIPMPEGA